MIIGLIETILAEKLIKIKKTARFLHNCLSHKIIVLINEMFLFGYNVQRRHGFLNLDHSYINFYIMSFRY